MLESRAVCQIAVFVLCSLACGNGEKDGTNSNDGVPSTETKAVPVETYVLRSKVVVEEVKATGTIFPLHDVLVSSQTAGIVTKLHAEVGDQVREGEALVQVDEELKQLAVEQAEAKLIEARAAFEKAEKDFARNEMLFGTKDISEYVFENVRLQKQSAEALFLGARANVDIARRQLRDARIASPISGVVAARLAELGSSVMPGSPVAKVVDISRVKIKFGLPEKDVVKIEKAKPAVIAVDSYPDERFQGEVSAVGPQADLASRSFPVEVLVDNPGFRLKAGMIARVAISARTAGPFPLLPKSAILERAGRELVFVVSDDIVEERFPKLALEKGDQIAVVEGLAAGEEVVISGQENLIDGSKVDVKKKLVNDR